MSDFYRDQISAKIELRKKGFCLNCTIYAGIYQLNDAGFCPLCALAAEDRVVASAEWTWCRKCGKKAAPRGLDLCSRCAEVADTPPMGVPAVEPTWRGPRCGGGGDHAPCPAAGYCVPYYTGVRW